MSQWIKCSDRMPDRFTDSLVTDGKRVGVKWWGGDKWDCWAENDFVIYSGNITHWMPLPEPPEGA